NQRVLPSFEGIGHVEVADVGHGEGEARVRAEHVVSELPAKLKRLLPPLARLLGLASIPIRLGDHGEDVPAQRWLLLTQGKDHVLERVQIRYAAEGDGSQGELRPRLLHEGAAQARDVACLAIRVDRLLVVMQAGADVLVVVMSKSRAEVE